MSVSVNHEWSEDGDCNVHIHEDLPCWKFSAWDIAGIGFGTLGGIFISIGTGLGFINRECQAAAQYNRQKYDEMVEAVEQEVARAEMAGALEGLVLFGEEPEPVDPAEYQ